MEWNKKILIIYTKRTSPFNQDKKGLDFLVKLMLAELCKEHDSTDKILMELDLALEI